MAGKIFVQFFFAYYFLFILNKYIYIFSLNDILYNMLYNLKSYHIHTTNEVHPRADTAQASVDLGSFGVTNCSYGFTWWVYGRKKRSSARYRGHTSTYKYILGLVC